MKFDFSSLPLGEKGFSLQPMTIIDGEAKGLLAVIMEIAMLETGNRRAREEWQRIQLENLLRHAAQRSAFWRARLGGKKPAEIALGALPILTRSELHEQVRSEGSLLRPAEGIPAKTLSTSGSSGTPVTFFVSGVNAQYNHARSIAQYFMEGRALSFNRTRIRQADQAVPGGLSVQTEPSWLTALSPLFRSGVNRHIEYYAPRMQDLMQELRKADVGYLVTQPRIVDSLLAACDGRFFQETKTQMWIAQGEAVGDHLTGTFSDLGIPIRSTYSAEEVGPIGFECPANVGHYHVATSNVIVEIADLRHELNGANVGRVLVTHLHSYATPFVRYDLDDLACMSERCPCGHDGSTIYALQGRASSVVKHRDGRLSPFSFRAWELTRIATFTEYRVRQTAFDHIVFELGGRSTVNDNEITGLTSLIKSRIGDEFKIEIQACPTIDWGQSRKRPAFVCEVGADR